MKGLSSYPPTHIRVIHLQQVSGGHEHGPSASEENQNSKEAADSKKPPTQAAISMLILIRDNNAVTNIQ